ncbi:MAG TPA: chromosome segregation protein SMC, partial [Burkholderiales bacterium]|nr:chromosome segregation protein SMC [Burkholderiales bacterium]
RDRSSAWDAAMQQLTGTEARIHALQQLQDKLARGAGMEDWLAARGLHDAPRLWQSISIETGWEDALESVLRERLNGLTLAQFDSAAEWLRDAPPGKMTVIDTGAAADSAAEGAPGGVELRRYVACRNAGLEGVLQEWLHGVYVVPDAASGMSLRSALRVGDILVTREGHICTRHSVSFHAPDSELHGVLSRQREIEALQQSLAEQRNAVARIQEEITAAEQGIEQHKAQWSELREAVRHTQQRHHELQMEAVRLTEQAQRFTQRGEQITAELAEIAQQTDAESAQRAAAEAAAASVGQAAQDAREQLAVATELHTRAETVVQLQREALQNARHVHQETQFELRTFELKIGDIEATLQKSAETIANLRASIDAERNALAECNDEPSQTQLQQALATRVEREQALARARDTLEGAEAQLKSVEQERLACEQRLDPLRERINEVRLREQEARLTEEQFARQLTEAGAREDELRAMLERGTRSSALLGEIARLNEEITALGAVNLAALEELQAAQERKTYLDAQSADLTEAMATLEDAIRRIDRETRERLQQTFDEVNAHFSKMFPALFGGGNARLVLTGDEILDAGVHVIAQPPGKKNSSIHLLSGGEKALTALALVFSMFQLNPAPFCLLDEVDAPLDDYNTGRFCDLVKQMSDSSQFLFISHNKITMEIAQQLLGITMQEPGVSRVVAVDIDEAMKLTEEAA